MNEQEAIEILDILKGTGAINGTEIDAIDVIGESILELERYRAIGTIEECQEAVEKQKKKKPKECEDKYYACPVCSNVLMLKWEKYPIKLKSMEDGLPYCLGCGQKLDWSE